MTEFLLLASDGARSAQASEGWELAIQYIAYGIVIVVSVLILLFIRKRTRLPRHTELKKKLEGLLAEVQELSSPAENRMQFVKRAARALYTADNLAYTAAMLAEKERYSDLGKISSLLEGAREDIAPYKYGKREQEEGEGIAAAEEKVRSAIDVCDVILNRDSAIKNSSSKK